MSIKKFEHIIYGAQYYRAPTPLECDWERDIELMKNSGFNTMKIWAQWGSNCPSEGVYDFTDIRTLLDIAHRNGIGVIVNIIMDAAPAWFCRKYPDSVMITGDGRRIEYQTVACRQIGGAPGPCFHFPEGIEARRSFIEALAEEISEHPALAIWDLWNEPELGTGIENRWPSGSSDLLCYCDHSRAKFIKWLGNKYETVENLNNAWHRYYNSFDEVELPRCGHTFQDMIDWRAFFADTIVEEARMRADIIRKHDSEHPVMVHTVPLPYFNMVAACSDDFRLAQLGDMHGNSIGTTPFSATVSVSAAEGKPVISSEMHVMSGSTYSRPHADWNTFKKSVFIPLSKGVKGFQYWQFRPERLGFESPAWGLTQLDGSVCVHLKYAEILCNALEKYEGTLLYAMPDKPEIAVINASENQVFDWCAGGSTDKYYRSLKGIFDALHQMNFNVDIVSTEQLSSEKLKQYKMIVYPFPHYVKCDFAARLKTWVGEGGLLVSECFFGAVTSEDGLFSEVVPGLGFDRVFGARESSVLTASVFHDSYTGSCSEDDRNNFVSITLTKDVGALKKGEWVNGFYFSEGFVPQGRGKVIAEFSDGRAAAVMNNYKNGSAVILGSLAGYCFDTGCSDGFADLLAELAKGVGVMPAAQVSCPGVRADVLKNDGSPDAVVVTNQTLEEVCAIIKVENLKGEFVDIISGEKHASRGGVLEIVLEPDGCVALCRAED